MAKKKFKDTDVGKFLLEKIPGVVGAIADETPVEGVSDEVSPAMAQYLNALNRWQS